MLCNSDIMKSEVKQMNKENNKDTTPEKTQYTPEQIELMEMYAALEHQAMADTPKEFAAEKKTEVIQETVEDNCVHKPVKSWKNYVPSKVEFICTNCGKPITFPPAKKKSMNLLLLVVISFVLMPSIFNLKMEYWTFGLLTLLSLVLGIAIQYFFVSRSDFCLKNSN